MILILVVLTSALILIPQFLKGEPAEGAGACDACGGWHVPGGCP
jgi:hypothetical protein